MTTFTIVLVFVAWKQRETLEAQRDLMRWALKHEQVADRAWIHLETLDIEPQADVHGSGARGDRVIAIGLKNSGRTPARIERIDVTIRGTKEVIDEGGGTQIIEIEDIPDGPDYDLQQVDAPGMLAAGEFTRFRQRVRIGKTNDNLAMLQPGDTGNIWIYGYVWYHDIFEPKKTRKYGWARRYDPILSARPLEDGRQVFRFAHINKPKYYYAD